LIDSDVQASLEGRTVRSARMAHCYPATPAKRLMCRLTLTSSRQVSAGHAMPVMFWPKQAAQSYACRSTLTLTSRDADGSAIRALNTLTMVASIRAPNR
ncbi:MAG TPA: hypothetical protein VJU59_08960, partial [Paraburkholderia sp.]|uniref:hypothetical protein n=1 Tax=Paraburkholderia sp. TaxID=1926495 RepID=UPI002B4A1A30